MVLNPATLLIPTAKAGDRRIVDVLGTQLAGSRNPTIALVGFCSDTGVKRNNGRTGAKGGPDAIREQFLKLSPECFMDLITHTVDLGNMVVGEDLEVAQDELGKVVTDLLSKGIHPVILGGGHETTYGHFLGYVGAKRRIKVINIDAHADVRPYSTNQGHSGSVFRQVLEHSSQLCQDYSVYGLSRHALSGSNLEYIKSKKIECIYADEFCAPVFSAKLKLERDATVLSFDLDGLDQIYAPGVSSPAAGGLSLHSWLRIAESAGASSAIQSIDIVELNPKFDQDGCTARNAALTLWHYFKGFSHR